jgi:hypothetical protein
VKFRLVPKKALVRGYFLLITSLLKWEEGHFVRDRAGAFDHAFQLFVRMCVRVARRVGWRITRPRHLRRIARKAFAELITP